MIFAPGGNTQALNRLSYLPAMNADTASQERRGVCVSLLMFINAFKRH